MTAQLKSLGKHLIIITKWRDLQMDFPNEHSHLCHSIHCWKTHQHDQEDQNIPMYYDQTYRQLTNYRQSYIIPWKFITKTIKSLVTLDCQVKAALYISGTQSRWHRAQWQYYGRQLSFSTLQLHPDTQLSPSHSPNMVFKFKITLHPQAWSPPTVNPIKWMITMTDNLMGES